MLLLTLPIEDRHFKDINLKILHPSRAPKRLVFRKSRCVSRDTSAKRATLITRHGNVLTQQHQNPCFTRRKKKDPKKKREKQKKERREGTEGRVIPGQVPKSGNRFEFL